jgi:hypothetical protein
LELEQAGAAARCVAVGGLLLRLAECTLAGTLLLGLAELTANADDIFACSVTQMDTPQNICKTCGYMKAKELVWVLRAAAISDQSCIMLDLQAWIAAAAEH